MSELKKSQFDTELGEMIAISDDNAIYLLEFVSQHNLELQIKRLKSKLKSTLISADSKPIASIKKELSLYFSGKLQAFQTPLLWSGSTFQNQVWNELKKIPYGETRSYLDIAKAIGNPSACRAVARANSTNQIAIVIPCHRVINASGKLGGYAGGIERKTWLINHELTCSSNHI